MAMKLGLQIGYWQAGPPPNLIEIAQTAEALGYDAIFTAETWGSDALTPLAWIGAHTEKIRLGSGIVQISARTPASTAMHAMTLDHLTGGRMILGLGVSGPQVVEGWYGQPFGKPVGRSREYISIIKKILARDEPVTNHGEHYPMPYTGEGAWGLGKPLRSIVHPLRSDIPVFLGAEGPNNVKLAADLCDGWLPLYYNPFRPEVYADSLANKKPHFEIAYGCRIHECDDVAQGLLPVKQNLSFYVGGMGAKSRNFHRELMARMGYEEESFQIQELFMSGKREEAVHAVPDAFADEISLVGSKEKIRERLGVFEDAGVTMIMLGGTDLDSIRETAELVLG